MAVPPAKLFLSGESELGNSPEKHCLRDKILCRETNGFTHTLQCCEVGVSRQILGSGIEQRVIRNAVPGIGPQSSILALGSEEFQFRQTVVNRQEFSPSQCMGR